MYGKSRNTEQFIQQAVKTVAEQGAKQTECPTGDSTANGDSDKGKNCVNHKQNTSFFHIS